MSDEGFHEIQLGGKQLVFLFMAAAVVGVVLFLSGVMVGRGVRNEKALLLAGEPAPATTDLAATSTEPAPHAAGGPTRPVQAAGEQVSPQPAALPATPPPPVADDGPRPATPEARKATGQVPAPPSVGADKAVAPPAAGQPGAKPAPAGPAGKPESTAKTPPRAADATPASYAVQVAAPKDRASADAIAKRLVGKGYSAYVVGPSAGTASPTYYRVRVGPFKSRSEADEARRRLEKEEQFKPFITR
jgi:DedD protein